MRTQFEEALMHRDGLTGREAKRERERATLEINNIISEGGTYEDVEDLLACDYGLEMDYLLELLL